MTLRILSAGPMTTIQDLGRRGYQRLGIPVGGALDPVSLRAANALTGNAPEAGVIEAMYVGPTFVVEAETARLAFVGANAAIDILPDEAATEGQRIAPMQTVLVRRGEVVRVGSIAGAATLYIAAEGGFDIAPLLGSVATDMRGRLGGHQGRALAAGDRLRLRQDAANEQGEVRLEDFALPHQKKIRVIAGPQSDYFSDAALTRFFEGQYTIGAGSNRMGMRLEGPALDHLRGFDIVSDAIAPGSIQIPGNGQPIVLLADRQTTGGYPKIATVISADLPALGRLPIGATIGFEPVTVEAAEAARRKLFAEIDAIAGKIVPLRRTGGDLARMLLDHNLISGVFDAAA
jgi:biotin-dependent carboxylase-like uncharacterized protein